MMKNSLKNILKNNLKVVVSSKSDWKFLLISAEVTWGLHLPGT